MTLGRHTPVVIGIGGGTGAGKSTLARILSERFEAMGMSVLDTDSYYQDCSHLSEDQRRQVNYDEPSAIDHELLGQHLEQLSHGQPVAKPRYHFVTHTRSLERTVVAPASLIVLEGIFALWEPRVRDLLTLKIFIEAAPDLRFIRRLSRDVLERGRTVESVIAQYVQHVRPMHERYVEPTRAYADLVLSGEAVDVQASRVIERVDDLLGMRVQ